MKVRLPTINTDGGPWVDHDQACAACVQRPAVYDCGTGQFMPCWECQSEGWALVRKSWWRRKLRRR